MSCDHKQCCICLRRECQIREHLQTYVGLKVCQSCIGKSVKWAHDTACRWGGVYADGEPCGEAQGKEPRKP